MKKLGSLFSGAGLDLAVEALNLLKARHDDGF